MSRNKDPLSMSDLDPIKIEEAIEAKKRPNKPINELDIKKEERLMSKEKRLSEKSFVPTPTSAPKEAKEAPVSEVDKSKLLDKLSQYRERFPHLKKRSNVTVKSSVEDILDEIHYCETQLGSKNDGNFGCMLLHGAMVALESVHRDVWNPLGLNLTGIAQVTKDNMTEFQPIVDELMIKYGSSLYVGPEFRLMMSISALMLTVHSANSGDARMAAALEKMSETVKVSSTSKDL